MVTSQDSSKYGKLIVGRWKLVNEDFYYEFKKNCKVDMISGGMDDSWVVHAKYEIKNDTLNVIINKEKSAYIINKIDKSKMELSLKGERLTMERK